MTSRTDVRESAEITDKARWFLRRVTIATGGGMFLDGFVFATIAAALAGGAMARDLGISTLWEALISASTLIGIFVGGLVIGYVTDRVGRKPMFLIDLATFMVCAGLMFFVTAPWQIFVIGLVMGLAIGGDYAIGSPLLSEFVPDDKRGNYLGVLEILWNVGYVVGFLFGFVVNNVEPGNWHWILASSIVPAIFCMVARHNLPESPRWLMSKGRRDEAEQVIRNSLDIDPEQGDFLDEESERTRWAVLFSADYVKRTVFACTFWTCIVLPYFALTFFQAEVLRTLGLGGQALIGALCGTIIALVGATTGWFLVDRVGRRKILIAPMFVCAITLALVGFTDVLPPVIAVACFFAYLLSYGVMSILPGIYPMELFPTSVRTSGVGLASSASRVGAAIGTFVLPLSLESFGLAPTMLMMAAVSAIGGFTSFAWAPETNGKALTQTAHRTDPHPYRRTAAVPA